MQSETLFLVTAGVSTKQQQKKYDTVSKSESTKPKIFLSETQKYLRLNILKYLKVNVLTNKLEVQQ